MSNPLLSSYSSCFVFTKHPVQLKTVTTCFQNMLFSKRTPKQKGGCLDTLDTPLDPPLRTIRRRPSTTCSTSSWQRLSRSRFDCAGNVLQLATVMIASRAYSKDFLPRDAEHRAVLAMGLCLCLSVTSRSSTKTAKRTITQITPHDSPGTLVF